MIFSCVNLYGLNLNQVYFRFRLLFFYASVQRKSPSRHIFGSGVVKRRAYPKFKKDFLEKITSTSRADGFSCQEWNFIEKSNIVQTKTFLLYTTISL